MISKYFNQFVSNAPFLYPSKENLLGYSMLLMNATYIVFPQGDL